MIPRTIHLVWITEDGGEPPTFFKGALRRWEGLAAEAGDPWSVRVWGDAEVDGDPSLKSIRELARGRGRGLRSQADFVKTAIVGKYGGFYFDADLVSIIPLDEYPIDPGNGAIVFSTVASVNSDLILSSGAFGAEPGHPFPAAVLTEGVSNLRKGLKNDHFVCGPRVFRTAYETLPEDERPEVSYTIQMKETSEESRIQREGGDFDMAKLRATRPAGAVVTHIDPQL